MNDDTSQGRLALNRDTWRHFAGAVRALATSDVRGQAAWLFGALIVLLLAISGLNVINSYVGRDFMTAIEQRDADGFVRETLRYLAVFCALTVVAVLFRFAEERLGLLWRDWMTRTLICNYLDQRVYYRLQAAGTLPNPDQRIADDVRVFTTSTLSLLLMMLNGTITVLAFSGVMLSISPLLFAIGVGYAAGGSLLTILLGRPLIWLNYHQSDREGDFRSDLVHLRENADSVALQHRERRIEARLLRRLAALTANLRRLIAVNRNLGFFTTAYNYFVPVLPVVIIAPAFIRGEIEFGVITQSAMAFSHLLGAFSLIVTQFQSISSYAAVLARLTALSEAVDDTAAQQDASIEVVEADDRVAYEALTLRAPRDDHVLIKALTATIPAGTRVLVRSKRDTPKIALFRATAGIWDRGEGRVIRPPLDRILFLPERPYLTPGTLREVLVRAEHDGDARDEDLLAALQDLNMQEIVTRAGGLDVERDWDDLLSLEEQQRLAFARLLLAAPRFVLLDRPSTALHADEMSSLLQLLCDRRISYITIANEDDDREEHYDVALELGEEGAWQWIPLRPTPAAAARSPQPS